MVFIGIDDHVEKWHCIVCCVTGLSDGSVVLIEWKRCGWSGMVVVDVPSSREGVSHSGGFESSVGDEITCGCSAGRRKGNYRVHDQGYVLLFYVGYIST